MFTKTFILFILILFPSSSELQINELKSKSKVAFLNRDFCSAIEYYEELIDKYEVDESEILLNQAHAYYLTSDTAKAIDTYLKVLLNNDFTSRSIAFQQLGIIEVDQRDLDGALGYLKESIQSDPANSQARYDYELIKKLICLRESEVLPCVRACEKPKPSDRPGEGTHGEWVDMDGPPGEPTVLPPGKIKPLLKSYDRRELIFQQGLERKPGKDPENDKPDW